MSSKNNLANNAINNEQPNDETLWSGRFLSIQNRNGWEFVARTNARAVVTIFARTAADEILLIEQVRKPLGDAGRAVIELPAGLVGDDDPALTGSEADILAGAQRELIEEAGYQAQNLRLVTAGPSSAGLTNELISFVLADQAERVGPGGGVDGEDIHLHCVPAAEVSQWLKTQQERGKIIDPKVFAGLWLQQAW